MTKLYFIDGIYGRKEYFHPTIESVTYYVGINDRYRFDPTSECFKDIFNSIQTYDADYITNNVSKMYRLKNLTLSRDKLSLLQDKCNFKITRSKDDADLVIIGKKTVEKFYDIAWIGIKRFTKSVYDDAIRLVNNSKIEDEDKEKMKDILDSIDIDSYISIRQNRYGYDRNDAYEDFCDIFTGGFDRTNYHAYIKEEKYQDYSDLLTNTYNLITEENVNKLCTEDSLVLNKDEFKNIVSMLKNQDKDNINVALAMMANCNYNASRHYLALLFAFYSDNMKLGSVWNTVNFKNLKKEFQSYIDITMGNWAHSYDVLIKRMVKDKCLTRFTSRVIANAMFKRVLTASFGVREDSVFTIDPNSLQLRDEFNNNLVTEEDILQSDLPF
tara:strand:- start:3060 stop:4211 length:1152 start_codon:yes stop_codon:yes gene_type:complete